MRAAINRVVVHAAIVMGLAVPARAQFRDVQELTELDRFSHSPGASQDLFGRAIDVDGNVMVVGAPHEDSGAHASGAVYVFNRIGDDWVQAARIVPPDPVENSFFGSSVAIWGDTVVVGAPFDVDSFEDQGAAYVFKRESGLWPLQVKLQSPAPFLSERFGITVDISELTIAVSTGRLSSPVYVYRRSFNVWGLEQALGASGQGLSLQNSRILAEDDGVVRVFERSGTSWTEEAIFTSPSVDSLAQFGQRILLWFDRAFVTSGLGVQARGEDNAVFVFEKLGSTWIEQQRIVPEVNLRDQFGQSLAFDGETLVVGSPDRDSGDEFDVGSVQLFRISDGAWRQAGAVLGNNHEQLGFSVALYGGSVLAGAPYFLLPSVTSPGEVVEFTLATVPYSTFCFGDGGDGVGCTPCPCGNDAFESAQGGCVNSQGHACRMIATGPASETSGPLRFHATGGSRSSFGVLTSGANALPQMGPCLGSASGQQSAFFDGLRCVGGGVLRHGARATNASGDVGNPWSIAAGAFAAGTTRTFAAVYRDLDTDVCQTGQNTSNGVLVEFGP